tara:strand:- start:46539 stop:47423 length:885 start_codon:yes stop_codon:yes gene_type:complete
MKLLLILFVLFPFSGYCFELLRSATFSLDTISSTSDLRTKEEEILFAFEPNVSTGFGLAVETEYISVGYVFSGGDPQQKDQEESRFRDIKFDLAFYDFDIRLNYQNYKGALVDSAGLKKFYRDYEVKSKNLRANYYFNKDILKFVRDGKALTNQAGTNDGYLSFSSWFLGLNLDKREIALPGVLASEHQARLDEKGVVYNNSFDVFSYGPLAGFDYFMFYDRFFLRGKFAVGLSFQGSGKTANQYEIAFGIGIGIKEDHAFSINVDAYIMSFKEDSQVIQNQNNQTTLEYNIAF